jgi:Collagen triple helix repeat (20 copies)
MIRAICSRLTFANVTALVALFVALGGSSYAALNLPKGSVGAKQLRKNAVTSPKVKPGSLLLSDFRRSQRAALRGLRGPQGPQGVQGPRGERGEKGDKGDSGAQGSPGLSGLQRVYASGVSNNSNSPKSTTATCPAGKFAIGGGYDIVGAKNPDVSPNGLANVVADVVLPSGESTVPGSVYVEAWEEEATALTWGVDAIALCANVAP